MDLASGVEYTDDVQALQKKGLVIKPEPTSLKQNALFAKKSPFGDFLILGNWFGQ